MVVDSRRRRSAGYWLIASIVFLALCLGLATRVTSLMRWLLPVCAALLVVVRLEIWRRERAA